MCQVNKPILLQMADKLQKNVYREVSIGYC